MCARRFLMIVVVLTLLVVAAAFAIFQYGDRVLVKSAVPQGHFQPPPEGGAPVYADRGLWLARPDMPGADDPSLWRPSNWPPPTNQARHAAVFYIHPTTYLQRDRWNASFVLDRDAELRTRLFVQSQASAFNGAGEVWAPRYRQAAFGAFLLKSADAQKALLVAYLDVEAAFAEFLREVPQDEPIILAGHSQGALHLERLLRAKIAGQPIARRVVAAYVVGWPVSTAADLPALGLPACRSASQTDCVLSWMSFGSPPNPDLILDQWADTRGFTGAERRQEDALCVNPISGVENGAAPALDNPGTLVPAADLKSATIQPGLVGAHCEKGLLVLDGVPPPLGSFVLPGNNYHVYDYALFWGAIRRDAERRLAAWHR
jgi:hypothetical protein